MEVLEGQGVEDILLEGMGLLEEEKEGSKGVDVGKLALALKVG